MINLKEFEAECRRDIPLLNAMELSFVNYEDLTLTMEAPLGPNINNKGTAFAGSIASIFQFSGWAACTLAAIDNGITNTETVIFQNHMTYGRPTKGHLTTKTFIKPEDFEPFLARLKANDPEKIKLDIYAELHYDDKLCASMKGLYVVWLK